MRTEELTTLAGTLVSLGIVFGSDRIIAYPFIGGRVALAIVSAIKARKKRGQATASLGGQIHDG